MPVTRLTDAPPDLARYRDLWEPLAAELRSPAEFGQPDVAVETFYRTGLQRVHVFWDRFDERTISQRSAVILKAYEEAFGPDEAKRVAFAVGYTVPEAAESGLLPFVVRPLLRRTDPPEWADLCRRAMADLGASVLRGADRPALRFRTREQAEAARDELVRRLPDTAGVWDVAREFAPGEGD